MQDERILNENYEYFLSQKRALLQDATKKGKFVVVKDKQIRGTFGHFDEAYIWAKNEFVDENFIIQQVIDESEITHFVYESRCR